MKTKTLLKSTLYAFVIAVIAGLSVNAIAQEDKEMTKKDLPPAVLQAFEKAFPKAVITGVGKEDNTEFEIESQDGNIQRNLVYHADGTLVETEEACDAKALPDAIQKTIAKEYPKGEIEKAEKITRGSVVEYEIKVEIGEQINEVVIDPAGKVIKSQKINEEDENGEKENESQEKDEK
jgi:hypothetical protein